MHIFIYIYIHIHQSIYLAASMISTVVDTAQFSADVPFARDCKILSCVFSTTCTRASTSIIYIYILNYIIQMLLEWREEKSLQPL